MKSKNIIAPSILSADFGRLQEEIKDVESPEVQWLHIDVMDGHFVPNLTFGPLVVKAIRPHTQLFLDCHLMVRRPENWIEDFSKAGADLITVHVESEGNLEQLLQKIRKLGCKAGISLNPKTSVETVEPFLDLVDLVLVMSVNPGFAGQGFIPEVLTKVEKLVRMREGRRYLIEIDGGINKSNVRTCQEKGADVFVAGSAIFGKKDRKEAIREFIQELGTEL